MPKVLKEYDPETFYWPASPSSGGCFDEPNDENRGDVHYWDVWHGLKPFDDYRNHYFRYMSEFGFQSFPEFGSIKLYAPNAKDWNIHSEVMMSHQRGGKSANSKIDEYLTKEYWPQSDFEKFLYMGQVMQGDAIKIAVEAHRRDMPFCQGSLFWQHNDCWPVASWASRDYYGRWKAQHYFALNYFDKYLLSAYNSEGRLRVYVVSDNQSNTKADFEVKVVTLTGKVVNSYRKSVVVPANTSTIMLDEATEAILAGEKAENVVIVSSLKVGEKLYTNNNFLVKQGALNFPACNITTKVEKCDGGVIVKVTSNNFARAVYLAIEGIDNFFEDNYFDLLPGASRTVKVKTNLSAEEFEKQLKVMHLGDCKDSKANIGEKRIANDEEVHFVS